MLVPESCNRILVGKEHLHAWHALRGKEFGRLDIDQMPSFSTFGGFNLK